MGRSCAAYIEVDLDLRRRARADERSSWSLWGKVNLSQHHVLFGLLGVRDEGEPLFALRGLPPGASRQLTEELDPDRFSERTWLSVPECREVLEQFKAELPTMPPEHSGQSVMNWHFAEHAPRREFAGLVALLTELEAVYPGVRMVFAFG
jgi:hypothetical protein